LLRKKIWSLTIVLFAISQYVDAQHVTGLQYSNYGGVYRVDYNPSVLGASRYKWQLNIGSLGGSISRRYFVFLGKNSLLYPLLAPHSTKELYGRSRTMGSLVKNEPLYLVSEIRFPSAMFSLGDHQGIAFQVRSRGFVQGVNVPEPIRNLYRKRLDTGSTPVIGPQPWGDFSLLQQSFSEADFSYGVAIVNTDGHKLKLGATLKRIFGARVGYIQGNVDSFSISATSADVSQLTLDKFTYEAGYSQQVKAMKLSRLFDRGQYGSGWGVDFGASYELGAFWGNHKEVYDLSPEYLVRLSGSLTDLGSISYQTKNSRVVRGSQPETVIDQANLELISDQGPEGLISILPSDSEMSFQGNTHLPAAAHLEADVQILKGFFLNLSKTTRLTSGKASSLDLYVPNTLTITPRWEGEDSDFSFPVTFMDGNKKAAIGALARFGPVFLGFSNLGAIFKRTGGSMAYVGVSAWRFKDHKKGAKR
jgi:hypothetical protein